MKHWIVWASLASLAAGVQAQTLSEDEMKFIQEQEKLQREQMLLKMQVQVLEQKAKAAELQRKIDGVGSPSSSASPLPPPGFAPGLPGLAPVPVIPGGADGATLPPGARGIAAPLGKSAKDAPFTEPLAEENFQLMSVFGKAGDLQAEILLNGTRIRVKPGDSIGSGWLVSSIQPTKLELSKGKQRKTLSF